MHTKIQTAPEYFARPHAMYCRTDGYKTIEQEALTALGMRQSCQFMVPYFTLLPQLVAQTDLIAVVPRSLAQHYSTLFPLHIFTPPFELPPFDVVMIWARNREGDSDQIWLRQIVRQAAAEPS